MLKLEVTLILEAQCPSCGHENLPLGENSRYGVVAVCPGCEWEHQVSFISESGPVTTAHVLEQVSERLREALMQLDMPSDVHLSPVRERRDKGGKHQ